MTAPAEVPVLRTRRPSGKPSWPLMLLAGAEKAGKSYSWATFSASDLIDRTFVIEVGEGAADQYGAIPGARFEIVEHDGSFRGIAEAAYAATMQPTDGKPHAVVVDSMTEVWDLLSSEQQELANQRRGRGRNDQDATITMDQWNAAKKRWRHLVDVLRGHNGPVILTARFEQVTVMGANGQPTADKTWKIRTEKNLPFEVDAIVEIPRPREFFLTGVRSLTVQVPPGGHMPMPDFTIDGFFRQLGLSAETTGERSYVAPRPEQFVADWEAEQARREAEARRPMQPAPRPPQDAPAEQPQADEEKTKAAQKLADKASRSRSVDGLRQHYVDAQGDGLLGVVVADPKTSEQLPLVRYIAARKAELEAKAGQDTDQERGAA